MRASRPLRARSLIVTVFGDVLAPRGGRIGLGSLIRVMEPFGMNERLVRTAVLRLVREEWISAERNGRRSDYFLTEAGKERVDDAARRIYAAGPPRWDGMWTLVLSVRDRKLRRALSLLGFGELDGVFLHPLADRAALDHAVAEHGGRDAVLLRAQGEGLGRRVREAWDLEKLAAEYRDFVAGFSGRRASEPAEAFLLRVLAVHEYRRILLRDPELPEELLGRDWPGARARAVLADLYRKVAPRAEAWISESLETSSGPLPPPAPSYYTRFGGLR